MAGVRLHGPGRPALRQRGNALVFALLGLLVSALGAMGVIQASQLQARRAAGNGEAGVLEALRGATNDAIFESLALIQSGAAFGRDGVSVAPDESHGELEWRPTIAQLVAMGYLPSGWTATTSTLNQSPYEISFRRVPAGCVASACSVEGHVVLAGPVRASGSGGDATLIGPILARLGADGGVSLPMDAAHIQGFGNTWSMDNPVTGQPAGVIAVRVGTVSSAYGAFVRIGDTRDPDLQGNLSVAGNTLFGNGSTRSEFRSAVQVDGQSVEVHDATGTTCVSLRPDGVAQIQCSGSLQAVTGVFRDTAGHVSTVAGSGLVTTGSVTADGGLSTPAVDAFDSADPNAMVVKTGDLFVRNPGGTALLRVAADGDVTAANDVVAGGSLQARHLKLSSVVNEGDDCGTGEVALMSSGGLATCQAGRFRATTRYASLGASCDTAGLQATDASSSDALICRGGYYASVSGLTSPRVYMAGFAVHHGDFISAAVALPNGCPATAGPVSPQATIFLLPQSDAETAGNTVLNRNAQWTGQGWTVSLTDGAGAATSSTAVAEIYCLYP